MLTLMISGSRRGIGYNEVMRVVGLSIEKLFKENPAEKELTLIHGGAVGVDKNAEEFVNVISRSMQQRGFTLKTKEFLPDYAKHGSPAAPHIRNDEMLDLQPNLVLCLIYQESKGTSSVAAKAKSKGLNVDVYRY